MWAMGVLMDRRPSRRAAEGLYAVGLIETARSA
jgi:hypothetical protein